MPEIVKRADGRRVEFKATDWRLIIDETSDIPCLSILVYQRLYSRTMDYLIVVTSKNGEQDVKQADDSNIVELIESLRLLKPLRDKIIYKLPPIKY